MDKMRVRFKPRAEKDLSHIPKVEQARILERIESLEQGQSGDVKRLTNFTPEYRLRVGNYRVLFEIVESNIVVYRVLHRSDAYR
jgi:mRNA interferase RelE/StbE